MSFEANRGQRPLSVRYLLHARGSTLEFTDDGWVLRRDGESAIQLHFLRSNPSPPITGLQPLPGRVNYLIGRDPAGWRTGIPTYGRIRYQDVYPGISLLYYIHHDDLEYDFVLSPGADPRSVALRFDGVESLHMEKTGDVVLGTRDIHVRLHRPDAYQQISGRRVPRESAWSLARGLVRLRVGDYDRRRPIVIDPVLDFSTYLGGEAYEYPGGIAVDAAGYVYVAGGTFSKEFPVTNGPQSFNAGAEDAFVTKLDPTGTKLIYSTYLGGALGDQARAIAVDAAGNVTVAGQTSSADFPVTAGAFQTVNIAVANHGNVGFLTRLNATGDTLLYSSLLGGSASNVIYGLALDKSGNAYVTGATSSRDFPTVSALQPQLHGAADGFVAKFDPTGSSLLYSSYLGGAGVDVPTGIAVDSAGSVTVTGSTVSTDFPTVHAFQSAPKNGPLFKSTDGGATWAISADGIIAPVPSLEVSPCTVQSLAIDPLAPSTLYAGTWSGIFKSTDSGATWRPQMNGLTSYDPVFVLLVDRTNPSTVYAGTQSDVFKSSDGGESWTAIDNGFVDHGFQVLVMDPANSSTLYTATASHLYRSTNGGGSWSDIAAGLPQNGIITSIAPGAQLYVGIAFPNPLPKPSLGDIYQSTDGGATWTPAGLNAGPIYTVVADPGNPATLYAGSRNNGVLKSTDGGQTWANADFAIGLQPVGVIRIDSSNPSHLVALAANGLFQSQDAANTWQRLAYTGAGIRDVAIDPQSPGNLYVGTTVPQVAFVTRLSTDGRAIVYSTYFGGHIQDEANAIAADPSGNIYVAGFTASPDLPVTTGAYQPKLHGPTDAFVAKLNPSGALAYATFLGGVQSETALAIFADAQGSAYVTGSTGSGDFPMANPLQDRLGGEIGRDTDAFVAQLDPSGGKLVFSTYLGGSTTDQGSAIVADASGAIYVLGQTTSPDFPVTPGAVFPQLNGGAGPQDLSGDVFIARLTADAGSAPHISFAGLRNAANQIAQSFLAPGEIIQIAGSNLGTPGASDTRVLIGGIAAPLLSVEPEMIEAIVPFGLNNTSPVLMEIDRGGGARSNTLVIAMNATAPGIFTSDGSGKGQGAILNQDGSVNSSANPAARGSVISIFGTGGGQTDPPGVDGAIASGPASVVATRVVASIGSLGAPVLYAGAAPGLIAGVLQVNVQIPDNAETGPAVPVQIGIGNISSGSNTTVAVK